MAWQWSEMVNINKWWILVIAIIIIIVMFFVCVCDVDVQCACYFYSVCILFRLVSAAFAYKILTQNVE